MKREIERLLYRAGVTPIYVGYDYFVEAVMMVYESNDRRISTCKGIYIPIAEKYGTDYRSVERNLRTVRDVFVKNNGKAIIQELGYNLCRERPYPREIIEIFAFYLKMQ